MSADVWILVATAVLAVVAVTSAVIAVRASRRVATPSEPPGVTAPPEPMTTALTLSMRDDPPASDASAQVVEGRVIVPPTQQQVVAATMGRPGVRLSIVAHGVAHALRPESRDRISGLMRREYRRRRRERLQAGRRAARAARPSAPSDSWLGS